MTLPASGARSFSDINTELGRSSTAQLSLNDSCVRTLFGQASGAVCMNTGHGKSNTSVPGAPTGVSGSATSCSAISVSFSAPASNGGLSIDYYQAISSPGCFTATGTSPISVTGLSAVTAYTFRVRAHNSKGYGCYSSSSASITTSAAPSSAIYCSPGTYTWYAPAGVTSVSVVAVGGGGGGCARVAAYGSYGGGGGGLGYKNNISVTPGTGYSVIVGSGGAGKFNAVSCAGGISYFINSSTVAGLGGAASNIGGPAQGTYVGDGGGNGGGSGYYYPQFGISAGGGFGRGGGGAGGYSGNGGQGGPSYPCYGQNLGQSGQGGGGGGGGGHCAASYCQISAGGGGVGLLGQGSNGSYGYKWYRGYTTGGGGGSCGTSGQYGNGSNVPHGGSYGGGGGRGTNFQVTCNCYGITYNIYAYGGNGGKGGVRIVWPGNTRQFPSSSVGSP